MKTAITILLSLLAGLVIGTWSVKADLRRVQKEAANLKEQLSRRPSGRSGGLDGITSMLKIPKEDAAPPSASGADNPRRQLRLAGRPPPPDGDTNGIPRRRHGGDRASLRRQLETAANAWKVRSDIARAGVLSNTAASDDQSAQFDVAMAAMNLRLSNSVRSWVTYVKDQQSVTPETGIRMMNDLSSSVVLAYDDLDRALPADWREKAGPKFQVLDFVNPEVIMPLTEVEDVFRRTDNAVTGSNAVGHRAP